MEIGEGDNKVEVARGLGDGTGATVTELEGEQGVERGGAEVIPVALGRRRGFLLLSGYNASQSNFLGFNPEVLLSYDRSCRIEVSLNRTPPADGARPVAPVGARLDPDRHDDRLFDAAAHRRLDVSGLRGFSNGGNRAEEEAPRHE